MTEAAQIVTQLGLGGAALVIIIYWVLPELRSMRDDIRQVFIRLGEIGAAITLLITSLPEIKRRTKEEAERLRDKLVDEEGK